MRLQLYRGKWSATGRAGGKQWRRSLGTADRAVAERRFRDLRFDRPGETIADYLGQYIAEKQEKKAGSVKAMQYAWQALTPTFANLRPDQITRKLCQDYSKKRHAEGVSDGTVIKELGVLKAGLGWAKKTDGAVFEMPATPSPRDRYITLDEFNALVEACELPHVKLFALLGWYTAGRATALFELTWDRVDFVRGQIRLAKGAGRQKGRATVPVADRLRAALWTAQEGRTTDFVIEWGGKPVKSVARSFSAACGRAGLADVSPHVLRHSAAVRMVENGVPLAEVGQYLGHTDLKVTYRVYARFTPGHLKRAADALG
jgi:integrase